MFKKLLSSFMVGMFVLSSFSFFVNANGSYEQEWKAPTQANWLNFKAVYQNGAVTTSWSKFTLSNGDSWIYYKVMRDQTNSNPVYPDNGYWQYLGDINQTSVVDNSPMQGTTYYRICAMVKTSAGAKYRYCSNVVAVKIDGSSSTTTPTPTPTTEPAVQPTTQPAVLSDSMKATIDTMVTNFAQKLDNKFGNDYAAKEVFLQGVSTAVTGIISKTSAKMKPAFSYLKDKIEELLSTVQLQKLLDI